MRTGVTVVLPPPEPLFAGSHTINGNGELTGLEWIRDSGTLTTPIGLTNTHSVGVVRDALVAAGASGRVGLEPARRRRDVGRLPQRHQRLPRPARARRRRVRGRSGRTGRGGIRRRRHRDDLPRLQGRDRHRLPRGRGRLDAGRARAGEPRPPAAAARERRFPSASGSAPTSSRCRRAEPAKGAGSIIVLIATDAPLLPGQCERRRAAGRLRDRADGRDGRALERRLRALLRHRQPRPRSPTSPSWRCEWSTTAGSTRFYEAVIDAVEESILNAMLASETMTGRDGNTVHGLPHELLLEALQAGSSITSST